MQDSAPQPIYVNSGGTSALPTPAAPPAPAAPAAGASALPPPPTYEEPKTDPLLELLTRQNQEQQYNAIGERVSAATSRAMMMYGVRRAMAGTAGSPLMA